MPQLISQSHLEDSKYEDMGIEKNINANLVTFF